MDALHSFLPLIGVIVGWFLKSGTDLLTATIKERATRRKCIFYLLRAWKALLDYERFVRLYTANKPEIEEYEAQRAPFASRLLARLGEDDDSLATGIEMLASIDPTAAVQLDNTNKNIRRALSSDFAEFIEKDPVAYIEVMNGHNDLIDWTLHDFQEMAKKLAQKAGFFQKRKVSAWFNARLNAYGEVKEEYESFWERLQDRRAKHGLGTKEPRE